ncbi:MAG: 16S rRNA (guanine(527)-N(7))-methyltransferase RsmG [Mycoplasmoidaceae bacterium]
MNKQDFEIEIKKAFVTNDETFLKIDQYKKFLITNNKKFNLTKLSDNEKIYLNYFFESIIVYKDILKNQKCRLLDIGSGSGIPGILIKIIFPKIAVTIIESNSKKCQFMNQLIELLDLKNIEIICKRAEDIFTSERETFDYVTSRAVADLKILIEISTPYLKINGLLIEPKSINVNQELEDAFEMIHLLSLREEKIINYNLWNRVHNVVVFKKTSLTPLYFPRSWKEIIS